MRKLKLHHKIAISAAVLATAAMVTYLNPILGVPNPDVTQANISQNICNPDWSTKSIRPPTSYTNPLKAKLCQEQNCGDPKNYELDHRIALIDGGAPKDPNNLWLEPYEPRPGAHEKDRLEVLVHSKICSGELTLKQGQDILRGDWIKYYKNNYKTSFGSTGDLIDLDDN